MKSVIQHGDDALPQPDTRLYDPLLRNFIRSGCARIHRELSRSAPILGEQVSRWMKSLSATGDAHDYFVQPRMFPMLLLPWWMVESGGRKLDRGFQSDVAYSTLNGYYYIRMLDNLMDGHGSVELALLPAAAFFHSEFLLTYQKYFEANHPFWPVFRSAWFSSSEAIAREARVECFDEAAFQRISVHKLSAARIPLAATSHFYHDTESMKPWSEFTTALARWSQMLDDLFDWHRDLQNKKDSYVLSQARSHKREGETVESWIAREGFDWGMSVLSKWLPELRRLAHPLRSAALNRYLDLREKMLEGDNAKLGAGLKTLVEISAVLSGEKNCSACQN
jgi:hypothetical protein